MKKNHAPCATCRAEFKYEKSYVAIAVRQYEVLYGNSPAHQGD